jgi:hypothetical protein
LVGYMLDTVRASLTDLGHNASLLLMMIIALSVSATRLTDRAAANGHVPSMMIRSASPLVGSVSHVLRDPPSIKTCALDLHLPSRRHNRLRRLGARLDLHLPSG